jgi:hypothetical protein
LIKTYNNISVVIGVPGAIVQMAGGMIFKVVTDSQPAGTLTLPDYVIAVVPLVIGTILFGIGLAFYAMAKGHSPVWGLTSMVSVFGFMWLERLEDRATPRAGSIANARYKAGQDEERFIEGESSRDALDMISFILGVVGLVICVLPGINLFLAVPAVICGHKALTHSKQNPSVRRRVAIAGLVCGYITIIINVLFIILLVVKARSAN